MNIGIVGAGIFGLAAALELRRRGHAVTVIEQGAVPNERASSTDVAKVVRRLGYGADVPGLPSNAVYLELVQRSVVKWKAWQERFESPVYHQTGQIYVAPSFAPGTPLYASWLMLKGRGPEIEVLSPTEARKRFPQFVHGGNDVCVYDPWGGYLESGRAISELVKLARSQGVQVREVLPVVGVEEAGAQVAVSTKGGSLGFDGVVVAAGAWMRRLVPQAGRHIHATRQQMAFYQVEDAELFGPQRLPVWSVDTYKDAATGYGWYGFPVLREGYLKLSNDIPGEVVDPDDHRECTKEFLASTREFVMTRMPKLGGAKLVGGRSCFYEHTPD